MGVGILFLLFFCLVAVLVLFGGITFFEELIFKKKYEKKNPTEKEDFQVFEDEVSDESSKIYKRIKEWWYRKKTNKIEDNPQNP